MAVGDRRRDHLSLGAVQQLEGALRHDAAPVVLPAAQRSRQQSDELHLRATATSSSTRFPAAPSIRRGTRTTRTSATTSTRSRWRRRPTARPTAAPGPSRRRSPPATTRSGSRSTKSSTATASTTARPTRRSSTQGLASYGLSGNFGQPSVVYRAPIRLDDVTTNATGIADQIVGYSDWTGATGTMMPPDATITTGVPGSGEGRLMEISGTRRHRPPAGLAGELLAGRLRSAAAHSGDGVEPARRARRGHRDQRHRAFQQRQRRHRRRSAATRSATWRPATPR